MIQELSMKSVKRVPLVYFGSGTVFNVKKCNNIVLTKPIITG